MGEGEERRLSWGCCLDGNLGTRSPWIWTAGSREALLLGGCRVGIPDDYGRVSVDRLASLSLAAAGKNAGALPELRANRADSSSGLSERLMGNKGDARPRVVIPCAAPVAAAPIQLGERGILWELP